MQAGFQKEAWWAGVGDDWLKRNLSTLGQRDMVSEALDHINGQPKSVLEIGCANGWRLKKLKDRFGCEVAGIDPSMDAIKAAHEAGIPAIRGTADNLPYDNEKFDCVIFGFCLCFIGPEEWSAIVAESDRVLHPAGRIIINDFIGTRFIKRRIQNITLDKKLEEHPVYLYNFDWPSLWTPHPIFRMEADLFNLDRCEICTVLVKDMRVVWDDIKLDDDK